MITKTQQLIDHMRADRWREALSLAATFRMLGPHRKTIVRAHECNHFPGFYAQLGVDPGEAVAAGIAALNQLYPPRKETDHV